MLPVQGLLPGRIGPFSTGVGFPVPTYTRLRSGSYVPVIHICPPVAPPLGEFGVPTGGVLWNVHWCAPISGSNDCRIPGRLSKSPETPTRTWLRMTSGALVDQ